MSIILILFTYKLLGFYEFYIRLLPRLFLYYLSLILNELYLDTELYLVPFGTGNTSVCEYKLVGDTYACGTEIKFLQDSETNISEFLDKMYPCHSK